VAYVEPSRRPTDGRYGEKPQPPPALLSISGDPKPSPLEIQNMYLDSLKAFGVEPLEHDIRFVEDDWESPTLGPGAWAGRSGSTAWKSPSSPTFSRPGASI